MSVLTETGRNMRSDEEGRYGYRNSVLICEIDEERSSELFEINHRGIMASIKEEIDESVFSLDGIDNDYVFVAVGKSKSSMDALSWTLKHAVNPSTTVFLLHVFPEIHQIPSPLGMLPKSKVKPEMVEEYKAQERGKRRELLQKFILECCTFKIKADTMLIESDMVAKAILDLIPVLNIRKLVVGITKSRLRKLRSRKGSGIADQVLKNAMETCEIKIVCEGKEVIDEMIDYDTKLVQQGDQYDCSLTISCMCFKSKFR